MTKLQKSKWALDYSEQLDYQALITRYSPPERFRVSEYRYPAGEEIHGAMRAGKCFIMSGGCKITMKQCDIQLQSGEYADLPEGTYRATVNDQSDVYMIMVWEIPKNPTST